MKLAKYLKCNNITGGYIDEGQNVCFFEYGYPPYNTVTEIRQIVVMQKNDTVVFHSEYKILDGNNSIYLIAPLRSKK